MRGRAAILVLLLAGDAAAGGFRHDGTARFPDARPPEAWSDAGPLAWRLPLAAWSNASPVRLGDLVCACEEPVTLLCADAATGAERWRVALHVVDTLPPDDQARLRPELEALGRADETLARLRADSGRLGREARRGDAAAEQTLASLSEAILSLQARLDAHAQWMTPPDKEMIGYSTPTPAVGPDALYPLFGNGVIARVLADGTVAWQRWLGPAPARMRGYTLGVAASPLWVDGTLIVGFGRLVGLDPATGAERWDAGPYTDYGTPAVVRPGGEPHIVTPDGRVVRVADGHVALEGLGEVYWTSPTADGDTLWFAGGAGQAHGNAPPSMAWRVDLAVNGEALRATTAWRTELPLTYRIYATPLVHRGRLYAVSDIGELAVLDAATGALRETRILPGGGAGHYGSPVAAGDLLLFGNERGHTSVLRAADHDVEVVGTSVTAGFRSTPLLEGPRLYLRTVSELLAVEAPR